jgi:hypothetical protein
MLACDGHDWFRGCLASASRAFASPKLEAIDACLKACTNLIAGMGSTGETKMRVTVLAAPVSLIAGNAFAASCKVEAANKKLAGAAMTSFMKKCEADAKAACDKSATDKKLSGAAKASHIKKCVNGAVGTLGRFSHPAFKNRYGVRMCRSLSGRSREKFRNGKRGNSINFHQ